MLVLLFTHAAMAACDGTHDDVQLAGHLADANAAYESVDIEAFRDRVGDVREALPCLGRPIGPRVAAELHRVLGIAAFVEDDVALAEKWFGAARRLEPRYVFPPARVPEGNPMLKHYRAFDLTGATRETLSHPPDATHLFDGVASLERLPELPVVYQRAAPSGRVVYTRVLAPLEPVPVVETETRRRFRFDVPLLVSAGLVGVGSGTAFALGAAERARFDDPQLTTTPEAAEASARRVNAFSVANIGLGATALGLGVGSAVVGTF